MTTTAPPRPRPAADLVAPLPLTEPAKELLTPEVGVRPYLEKLVAAGLTVDALRVLALALPKPEAVWWACVCIRLAVPKPWLVSCENALDAAEKWAKDPAEANRRACGSTAEAAGWDTAHGCAAGAAWVSGGSLSPPNLPPVQPREDLTAQMVAGALRLASVFDPLATAATTSRFVQIGMTVADGKLKRGDKAG